MCLALGCTVTKNSKMNSKLNGTWIPISQEMGGTSLPNSFFVNQKLILQDTTYTVNAESIDKGIVKRNGNKLDIYGKEGPNAGKHFTAIYKLQKDQLTICYNLAGHAYPELFETKPNTLLFLSVFKKESTN